MDKLERLDRRAFLRGMMVTSAGLVVPKPARVFIPEPAVPPGLHAGFWDANQPLIIEHVQSMIWFTNGSLQR